MAITATRPTVGTSATLLSAGISQRDPRSVLVVNPTGSGRSIFVGGSAVTTGTGLTIAEGGSIEIDLSTDSDDLYAIAAANTNIELLVVGG